MGRVTRPLQAHQTEAFFSKVFGMRVRKLRSPELAGQRPTPGAPGLVTSPLWGLGAGARGSHPARLLLGYWGPGVPGAGLPGGPQAGKG